jgi:hypothetical protein
VTTTAARSLADHRPQLQVVDRGPAVDLAGAERALEDQGVASFRCRSSTCSALQTKARQLAPR